MTCAKLAFHTAGRDRNTTQHTQLVNCQLIRYNLGAQTTQHTQHAIGTKNQFKSTHAHEHEWRGGFCLVVVVVEVFLCQRRQTGQRHQFSAYRIYSTLHIRHSARCEESPHHPSIRCASLSLANASVFLVHRIGPRGSSKPFGVCVVCVLWSSLDLY